ncbi:MAG TPA: VWA domain-containing protein, partial [Pirellulales bacterium]|nr:VWA domain-containing protein [Pirellulales bacterium]
MLHALKVFSAAFSVLGGCWLGVGEAAAAAPSKPPGAAASGKSAPQRLAAKASPVALDTFIKPDGEGFFALSLTPDVPQPPQTPRQLAVLFDTSASQTGVYRAQALAALEALLAEQSPDDRVALLAVDLNPVKLTSGFVPASSEEMRRAIDQLKQRVPLGTTDMVAALAAALELQAAAPGRVGRIAYLGDGMSPMNSIAPQQMRDFADRFIALRTSVSSYGLGPQVDLQLLGALAKNTGGMLVLASEDSAGRRAGGELADAVRGAVFWPTSVELPEPLHVAYYRGVPPLRFDRDTVVIGGFDGAKLAGGPLKIRAAGELAGKPLELRWQVAPGPASDDHAYLGELVKMAERDGGVSLPSVGSAGLSELRRLANVRTRGLVRLSEQALALGNLSQAEQLADHVSQIDPNNPAASIVQAAVRKAHDRSDGGASGGLKLVGMKAPRQGAPNDGEFEAPDGELLDQVERQQRVYQQYLRSEVRNAVGQARGMMGVDPEQAADMLKLTLEKVAQAPEIDPELRAQLEDQIEAALRAASQQALVKSERDLRREQIAAERQARQQINRELFIQEQKVDQLMARFNALMDEERYRDAEAIADIAEAMSPGTAGLRDAELTARMTGYTADMNAVRDARHKGVIDATYQIELALVPQPDEPPILYPDPEVWQLLTERRKKYKAVDLTENNPSEAKIMAALDDKTELEFVDQPLSDVVEYLRERHEIEIQLDNKALADAGLGSDTPVTRNIKGITLRSALRLMLGEMDLTYVIRDEVLMITTKTEA